MTKEEKRHEKLNSAFEKLYSNYCDYEIELDEFEKDEPIQGVCVAIVKDLPLDYVRLSKLYHKVNLKYHLVECPTISYIGLLHDFAGIYPLAKSQFCIKKSDETKRLDNPSILEFIHHYNTGTYVIISGDQGCCIQVVHNGKILEKDYARFLEKIKENKSIKEKEDELKSLQKYFKSKIQDCIKIENPNKRVKFYK